MSEIFREYGLFILPGSSIETKNSTYYNQASVQWDYTTTKILCRLVHIQINLKYSNKYFALSCLRFSRPAK